VSKLAIVFVVVACGACGSKGPAGPPGPSGPQGSNAPDAGPPPSAAPAGIAFQDTDPRKNVLGGVVAITHAADESNITSYALYFGSNATTKADLSPIVVIAKTGADVFYTFPIGTTVSPGTTTLLAFAANADGENPTPVAVTPIDNFPAVKDLSPPGMGAGTFRTAGSPMIDATNGKLLALTQTTANSHAGLLRCDLDTTNCTAVDLGFVGVPIGVIDTVNTKLDVFFIDPTTGAFAATAFAICNLDGTGCTSHPLSFNGLTVNSVLGGPVVDAANQRVMIAFDAFDNSGLDHAYMMRVTLDGATSAPTDFTGALANNSLVFANVNNVIDTTSAKLYSHASVFNTNTSTEAVALYRCDLDATNCTQPWLPGLAWQFGAQQVPATTGGGAAVVVDATNARVIALDGVSSDTASTTTLVRCDSTFPARSCLAIEPSDGVSWAPMALVLDPSNSALFASALDFNVDAPRMVRCVIDGAGCVVVPAPLLVRSMVVDATNQRLIGFAFVNRLPQAVVLHLW
jgi:hypothetical protein